MLLAAYASPLYAASPPSYDCLIEPAETVELGTAVGGVLGYVYVRRGERIKRGQVLAMLDSRAEQAAADLARYKSQLVGPSELAEAKIEFSKRKFERRKDMATEKLLAQQDSDDAESELRQAQADFKVAQENRRVAQLEYAQQQAQLALRTIRSPFDGVVVDQMIWPGETVEPGAAKHAILKLARLDPLHVRVVMPMQAFGKFRAGMKAAVVPEIQPGKSYTASISSVDPTIDPASGTFVVFLDLPNPRFDTPSGVKCRATFGAAPSRQQASQ
ncbi:efflux RND transporter periplasmic adaptor subunit [Fulvimonas sp. R45]|uniref:efflux RND transporter periplasmic adaptor subunit n=1 Tax=Fulvimonas sp. R45 TaxID=3045937 RepID=UPI00265FAF5E|nr:efflux RND transporter periplasmic adaptor subunit [Fulvimonas sp. R45]MDO1527457.1 efflux RND transporter periplasmic adaptor subunit [Fulvimonas sp. R45]